MNLELLACSAQWIQAGVELRAAVENLPRGNRREAVDAMVSGQGQQDFVVAAALQVLLQQQWDQSAPVSNSDHDLQPPHPNNDHLQDCKPENTNLAVGDIAQEGDPGSSESVATTVCKLCNDPSFTGYCDSCQQMSCAGCGNQWDGQAQCSCP